MVRSLIGKKVIFPPIRDFRYMEEWGLPFYLLLPRKGYKSSKFFVNYTASIIEKEDTTMFENRIIEGIHISRFIASWVKEGGKLNFTFKEWLKTLTINGRKLTYDEIREIYDFGTNGKLELETLASRFLKNNY